MTTSLPPEIILGEILPRVPAKSLVRFRSVCKLWCDTIADQQFVQGHLHTWKSQPSGQIVIHSSGNKHNFKSESDEEFDLCLGKCLGEKDGFLSVRASCDGLLLVYVERISERRYNRNYYVCNPITRCSRKLPIPPFQWFGASGLAYDLKILKYKVVGWFDFGHDGCKCMVFTLTDHRGLNGSLRYWRELGLPKACRLQTFARPTYVRGEFHWVAFNYEFNTPCIISMDVMKEELKEITLPKFELDNSRTTIILVGLKESLYLAHSSFIPRTFQLGSTSLWVLKNADDEKHHNVWTKLCYIESGDCDFEGALKIHKFVSYDTNILLDLWLMVINKDRERYTGSFSEAHINSLVSWDGCEETLA